MKCVVCDHPATNASWCQRHAVAVRNLAKYYTNWVTAYGELSWKDYLDQIIINKNTGSWVLEVAKTFPSSDSIT
ncbi:MAG: hypothetical protein ACXACA_05960 [Candidatus Ranarchaeia archaeon]|jgi:hypothetical protein